MFHFALYGHSFLLWNWILLPGAVCVCYAYMPCHAPALNIAWHASTRAGKHWEDALLLLITNVRQGSYAPTASGTLLNIKAVFLGVVIPMLKIRRSWDRLIFNMGISILVRRHFYIETVPWEFALCWNVLFSLFENVGNRFKNKNAKQAPYFVMLFPLMGGWSR